MQRNILAAGGYAVAAVNYRGSSGRGKDYIRSIYGDWGNKEVTDILGAADYLIAQGIADSSRMAIGGWSYGGILTDYTIATTTRFKAAASGAGSSGSLWLRGVPCTTRTGTASGKRRLRPSGQAAIWACARPRSCRRSHGSSGHCSRSPHSAGARGVP